MPSHTMQCKHNTPGVVRRLRLLCAKAVKVELDLTCFSEQGHSRPDTLLQALEIWPPPQDHLDFYQDAPKKRQQNSAPVG